MSAPSVETPAAPAEESARVLSKVLESLGSGDFDPPRLPEVVRQVLELTNRQEVRLRELHEAIETDSLLAARLVKAARSPVYGRLDVRSLRDALVRLGNGTVRNVVLEIALDGPLFESRRFGQQVARTQLHNRCVAHLSRVIARAARVPSEQAFLCGLLHDIGVLAILQFMDGRLPEELPDTVALDAVRATHAEGSRRIAEVWGLNDTVTGVLDAHHRLELTGPETRPMVACLNVAEAIAGRLAGDAPDGVDGFDPGQTEASMEALGLGVSRIGDIVREGEQIVGPFLRPSRAGRR